MSELERLQQACAEAYQVVADLAERLGCVDHPAVVKMLDNLDAASNDRDLPHDDVLTFHLPETFRRAA